MPLRDLPPLCSIPAPSADYHAPSLTAPTTQPVPVPEISAPPARPNPGTSLDAVFAHRLLLSTPRACPNRTAGSSPGAGTAPPHVESQPPPTTCPRETSTDPGCWRTLYFHLRRPTQRPPGSILRQTRT